MRARVAVIYNEPCPSRYDVLNEKEAELGVLQAVDAVQRALLELDYNVVSVPLAPPLELAKDKLGSLHVDLVFNLFEGFAGYPETEALLAGFLEELGIPFTGCPGAALRLALDKARVKAILQAAGIKTPSFQLLTFETVGEFRLEYPCIVKPCCEDASHGLSSESVVSDSISLEKQVELISRSYGGSALVEEFIDGREFNATVLANCEYTVLPVSEIAYYLPPAMPRILTFAAKWETDSLYFQGTKPVCPADIEAGERKRITELAVAAFRLLDCHGYARVDMRMDSEGEVNIIELNPNPDISPGSGAVRQAAAAGMSYRQFVEKIVELALGKERRWASISVP